MAILESSFLIDLMHNNKNAVELIDELETGEKDLFIATPSVMELWEGALLSQLPEREKIKIDKLLSAHTILDFDAESAKRSAEIEIDLTRAGQKIENEDCMIAGIALASGEKIVTRDQHYLRIPGLKVLKY